LCFRGLYSGLASSEKMIGREHGPLLFAKDLFFAAMAAIVPADGQKP
jgi:hypothetical protein